MKIKTYREKPDIIKMVDRIKSENAALKKLVGELIGIFERNEPVMDLKDWDIVERAKQLKDGR